MIPDIILHRLYNHQLNKHRFNEPAKLVEWMGAVQAQDYSMCKWAVGVRVPGSTDASVEKEIDSGKIIRTHVLRPTWHLVHINDVRWMLELTAARINKKAGPMYRQLELDEKIFRKANNILLKILKNGEQLSREEMMSALEKKGIATHDLRGNHILFRAELDMIVCNGARRGKQFTYTLFDERIPPSKKVNKEEALGNLALKYLDSHGPATLKDFTWWSGLAITDAKIALESVKSTLWSENIGDHVFWFRQHNDLKHPSPGQIHFLPAYDEWMISYAERSHSLASRFSKQTILNNGIFKPVIILDGKVVGLWKRITKNNSVDIEINLLVGAGTIKKKVMNLASDELGNFLGTQLDIHKV